MYKTVADPFVGKLSLFRVCSGSITPATALYNSTCEKAEKAGGLFVMRGKKQQNATVLNAGDLGALSKLQYTNSGDTLCEASAPVKYAPISFPIPCISKAVYAAKQVM